MSVRFRAKRRSTMETRLRSFCNTNVHPAQSTLLCCACSEFVVRAMSPAWFSNALLLPSSGVAYACGEHAGCSLSERERGDVQTGAHPFPNSQLTVHSEKAWKYTSGQHVSSPSHEHRLWRWAWRLCEYIMILRTIHVVDRSWTFRLPTIGLQWMVQWSRPWPMRSNSHRRLHALRVCWRRILILGTDTVEEEGIVPCRSCPIKLLPPSTCIFVSSSSSINFGHYEHSATVL